MSSGFDYRKFFVMYVDDEAQSLKYFRKGFEKDFVLSQPKIPPPLWRFLPVRGKKLAS